MQLYARRAEQRIDAPCRRPKQEPQLLAIFRSFTVFKTRSRLDFQAPARAHFITPGRDFLWPKTDTLAAALLGSILAQLLATRLWIFGHSAPSGSEKTCFAAHYKGLQFPCVVHCLLSSSSCLRFLLIHFKVTSVKIQPTSDIGHPLSSRLQPQQVLPATSCSICLPSDGQCAKFQAMSLPSRSFGIAKSKKPQVGHHHI